MRTLTLHDGGAIPALGLGTWLSAPEEVYRAVRHALEIGYRHIDGAWIYLNEEEVGRAIREAIAAGEVAREELWVTTKLWNDHHAPEHVRPALERSLGLLGLDYVDLYLVHWPVAHRHGIVRPQVPDDYLSLEQMPLERTWEAMAALPGTGLARHVGVSNFSAAKIARLIEAVGVVPAVDQVELHPFNQQNDLLEFLRRHDIVATAYAPLGSRGRPESMRARDEPSLLDHSAVLQLAEAKRATPAQILIAWALARGTSVIPKSTHLGRIRENFEAASLSLSADEVASLASLDAGARYVTGDFWCPPGSPYTVASLWDEE
jgi:alcohol dehydrogenase (NADP+)